MAHHAIFRVVAERTVQLQRHMALIAIADLDYRAPVQHRRTIHRKVHNLVRGSVGNALLRRSSGQYGFGAPRLDTDRVCPRRGGRDRMRERVHAVPAPVASGLGGAFGHVAWRGDAAAKTRVAVIGSGSGHGERNRTQLRDRDRLTGVIQHREAHYRRVARRAVLDLGDIHRQPGEQARCGRRHVRAHNRGVKIGLALRNVAGRAHAVVDLDPAGVIGARREIDIVVARPAGGTRRIRRECGRLGRAAGLRMADLAAPRVAGIRRKDHC